MGACSLTSVPEARTDAEEEAVQHLPTVVPAYYQFVARPTGAFRAFALPLRRALAIYRGASQQVSGLARTARGPVMSADPGNVQRVGMLEGQGEELAVLRLIQSRRPELAGTTALARLPPDATWLDELEPVGGAFPWDRQAVPHPAGRAAPGGPELAVDGGGNDLHLSAVHRADVEVHPDILDHNADKCC